MTMRRLASPKRFSRSRYVILLFELTTSCRLGLRHECRHSLPDLRPPHRFPRGRRHILKSHGITYLDLENRLGLASLRMVILACLSLFFYLVGRRHSTCRVAAAIRMAKIILLRSRLACPNSIITCTCPPDPLKSPRFLPRRALD